MLVAHGWNVDYSAWFLLILLVLLRCGTQEREGPGRARCWVSEGAAVLVVLQFAGPGEASLVGGV